MTYRFEGYICMTPELTWGWGETPQSAVTMARKANHGRGARKGERLIYKLPVGAINPSVDGMGRIIWDWADDAPDKFAVGVTIESPRK